MTQKVPARQVTSESAANGYVLRADGLGGASFDFVGEILTATPTGSVTAFASSSVPIGWLECNGAAVSRTTYAALYGVIGTTWGVGDGSTTFNLPDFRGEFLRGWDNGRAVDNGRTFASFQADEFKSHTHIFNSFNGGSLFPSASGTAGSSQSPTSATGGTETRPRNIAIMYIIKT